MVLKILHIRIEMAIKQFHIYNIIIVELNGSCEIERIRRIFIITEKGKLCVIR